MSYFSELKIKGSSGNLADVNSSGQLHVVERGKISASNSTIVPLGIAGVFTGGASDLLDYSAICVMVGSDVEGSLVVQFSPDAVDWHDGETYVVKAGAEKFFTPPVQGAYYRLVYTNGAVAQTTFFIHTTLKKQPVKNSRHNIDMPISDQDDAVLMKAVITGKRVDGVYDNVSLTNGNNLKMSLEELESGVSSNSNSQLNVTPFHADGTEGALITGVDYVVGKSGVDASTEVLETIDYEHHEIHSGSHYNYCDYKTGLGSGVVTEFVITTPDSVSQMHLTFEAFSTTGATLELFEGTSGVVGGTARTPRNNNRNSVNVSGATIVENPASIASDGVRAAGYLLGGSKSAGAATRSNELVLAVNATVYLVRITTTDSSNDISFCSEWYEHTPKN